jgi:hypothetical protein
MPEFNGSAGGGGFPGFLGGNTLTPPSDIPPEAVEVFEHWESILENDEEFNEELEQALEDNTISIEEENSLFDRAFNLIADDIYNNTSYYEQLAERYRLDVGPQCSMLSGDGSLVM